MTGPGVDEPAPQAGTEMFGADASLAGALEAILLVVDEPVPDVVLAQVLQAPRDDVRAQLRALAQAYLDDGRGFELREVAGGWRYYTSPAYASVVERFVVDGQQARLTQAALETLAVVAYRQPVSRARVSAVRGVNVDGVIRTLVSRGLIEECGTDSESGALLYQTTTYFLERLGLSSLDQLPPLAPYLPDIETMDIDQVSPSG
jgi:segregation and condensation protein B